MKNKWSSFLFLFLRKFIYAIVLVFGVGFLAVMIFEMPEKYKSIIFIVAVAFLLFCIVWTIVRKFGERHTE